MNKTKLSRAVGDVLPLLATILLTSFLLAGCTDAAPADADPLKAMPISPDPMESAQDIPDWQEPSSDDETKTKDDGSNLEENEMRNLQSFLTTALLPLGNTMYVWGGGWNEEDTGAGPDACTLGVSENWAAFAAKQTAKYNYRETRYQIRDGLDCSGYVGWVVYNVMETEDGREGYVFPSTEMAEKLASFGWGTYLPADAVQNWRAGDVASMKGHVWICLGTCGDGSVLLIHSSPPGVRLCGTAGSSGRSDAVTLAEEYMKTHYPDWYDRFPDCQVSKTYLTSAGQFRWSADTFPDAEEIRGLTPAELMKQLYEE